MQAQMALHMNAGVESNATQMALLFYMKVYLFVLYHHHHHLVHLQCAYCMLNIGAFQESHTINQDDNVRQTLYRLERCILSSFIRTPMCYTIYAIFGFRSVFKRRRSKSKAPPEADDISCFMDTFGHFIKYFASLVIQFNSRGFLGFDDLI